MESIASPVPTISPKFNALQATTPEYLSCTMTPYQPLGRVSTFVYRVVWVAGFLVHGMPLAISVLVTILYYKKPFWFEQTNSISLHIPMMPVQVNIKFYCCIKSGVANSAFYTSLISAQSYS